MKITDLITDTLQQLLSEHGGVVQIQRNDLANRLGCVPSQVSYVLTSRFTKEQGYIVESRRGGGGFIRIVRVDSPQACLIMHVINSIGDELDEATARALIQSLHYDGRLGEGEAKLMLAAISDSNFKGLADGEKQRVRANLLKSMLIHAI